MLSMTGFANKIQIVDDIAYTITIKSVNSRFLDISVQLPSFLQAYEYSIKQIITKKIIRGKIDFSIQQKSGKANLETSASTSYWLQKAQEYKQFIRMVGLKRTDSLQDFIAYLDIISKNSNVDSETVWKKLELSILECIEAFNNERIKEGNATKQDLLEKLHILESAIINIDEKSGQIESAIEISLRSKFSQVAGNIVDENRILSEIAAYAVRYTINEEVNRFKTHVNNFRLTLDEENCGKKLDFISQELNREANTIASKVFFPEISTKVIEIKQAVEDIREQIRNIE